MELLLIEDNAATQAALQHTFSRRSIKVVACNDGRLALAQWTVRQSDLAVLDPSLPGMGGFQHLLQNQKRFCGTPPISWARRWRCCE